MAGFGGSRLVAQHQDVAHGQDVGFGDELNVAQPGVRAHQLERADLLFLSLQGLQELRNPGLAGGLGKVVNGAADDLFARQTEKFTYADAGILGIAFVIRDEDGGGRLIDNRPEEEFQFSRTVLHKPLNRW